MPNKKWAIVPLFAVAPPSVVIISQMTSFLKLLPRLNTPGGSMLNATEPSGRRPLAVAVGMLPSPRAWPQNQAHGHVIVESVDHGQSAKHPAHMLRFESRWGGANVRRGQNRVTTLTLLLSVIS